MILAELEICHSRPIAPTRRVGLANRNLPTQPAPGLGGVLLAGIVANSVHRVDPEDREALFQLLENIQQGEEIYQPAVRHRFQEDLVGLTLSRQLLVRRDTQFAFELDDSVARPVQLVLGALYAAQQIPQPGRLKVLSGMKLAWVWEGPLDQSFMHSVLNNERIPSPKPEDFAVWSDPVGWALETLAMGIDEDLPSKRAVQKRFRLLLREAHPDHGAVSENAAEKIKRLTDARDILVAAV